MQRRKPRQAIKAGEIIKLDKRQPCPVCLDWKKEFIICPGCDLIICADCRLMLSFDTRQAGYCHDCYISTINDRLIRSPVLCGVTAPK